MHHTSILKDEPVLVAFFNAAAAYSGVELEIAFHESKNPSDRLLVLTASGSNAATQRFLEAVKPAFVSPALTDDEIAHQFGTLTITRGKFTPLFAATSLTAILHQHKREGELFPHESGKGRVGIERLIERHFEALSTANSEDQVQPAVPALA